MGRSPIVGGTNKGTNKSMTTSLFQVREWGTENVENKRVGGLEKIGLG